MSHKDKISRKQFITMVSSGLIVLFVFNFTGFSYKKAKKEKANPKIDLLNIAIEHEYGQLFNIVIIQELLFYLKFNEIILEIIKNKIEHVITITNILKNFYAKLDINVEKGAIELYEEILKLDYNEIIKNKIKK